MGNTVRFPFRCILKIVGADMAAAPVGKPARILTVDNQLTSPLIRPGLENRLSGFDHQPLLPMKIVTLALSFLIPPAYLCRTVDCLYRCIDEAFCFPDMPF
jgi:hypothetical protein